jgi:hypothetical protein
MKALRGFDLGRLGRLTPRYGPVHRGGYPPNRPHQGLQVKALSCQHFGLSAHPLRCARRGQRFGQGGFKLMAEVLASRSAKKEISCSEAKSL